MVADVPLQHRRRRQSPGRPARRNEGRISELVYANGLSQAWQRHCSASRHVQFRTIYVSAGRLTTAFPNGRDLQRTTNNRQTTPARFLDGIVGAVHAATGRAWHVVYLLWLSRRAGSGTTG